MGLGIPCFIVLASIVSAGCFTESHPDTVSLSVRVVAHVDPALPLNESDAQVPALAPLISLLERANGKPATTAISVEEAEAMTAELGAREAPTAKTGQYVVRYKNWSYQIGTAF